MFWVRDTLPALVDLQKETRRNEVPCLNNSPPKKGKNLPTSANILIKFFLITRRIKFFTRKRMGKSAITSNLFLLSPPQRMGPFKAGYVCFLPYP